MVWACQSWQRPVASGLSWQVASSVPWLQNRGVAICFPRGRTSATSSDPKGETPVPTNSGSRAAARTLDILDLVLEEARGFSLREIGARLTIPLSSSRRLVHTLIERDYLVRDEHSLIRLGPKLGLVAAMFIENSNLLSAASPVMDLVQRLCGETVGLGVLYGGDIVLIDQRLGRRGIRAAMALGTPFPAHSAAIGKAILALLTLGQLDEMYPSEELHRAGPDAITRKGSLLAVLDKVRETGVGVNRNESDAGAFAVGSAILDHHGTPMAGIAISAVSVLIDRALEARLAALVKAAASLISYRLGYLAPGARQPPDADTLRRTWDEGATIQNLS